MFVPTQLSIRQITPEDRHKLASVIHFETYVHRHLDFRSPLDWIGHEPFLIAEARGNIYAALACPPDPPSISWIRLFASSMSAPMPRAWEALWAEACDILSGFSDVRIVAAITLHDWFSTLLRSSQFTLSRHIVMLDWNQGKILTPVNRDIHIRRMEAGDLEAVCAIDTAAFGPIWQYSLSCLEDAFQQAAVATVAERDGILVGYQISTRTSLGGHLARLAVLPDHQNQGIGLSLLADLLEKFKRRGAQYVTVNTQEDNLASLFLYKKAGFCLTGEKYPIYQFDF